MARELPLSWCYISGKSCATRGKVFAVAAARRAEATHESTRDTARARIAARTEETAGGRRRPSAARRPDPDARRGFGGPPTLPRCHHALPAKGRAESFQAELAPLREQLRVAIADRLLGRGQQT